MSEARELKTQVVKEIKDKIEKSKSFVIVDYRGITVAQDTELRAMMRKSGVEYKVLKNRLVKIALNELGYTQYDEALNGPTAIAFGMDDVVAPAKILVDNAQQFPKLEIKCGMAEKSFIDKITDIKGFKMFIFAAKALIENFVETSDSLQNNKFDFGPINTIVSYNDYDKTRFRISGLTTAHLNPHLFWSGYAAYGTKTKNFYGKTEFTYAFNKKAYLTREFPKNNLSVYYWNDVISPFDKFIPTDEDNMFTSIKTNKVDQYMHTNEFKLMYDREWYDGMKNAVPSWYSK